MMSWVKVIISRDCMEEGEPDGYQLVTGFL
jgi:hypothetical protein